MQIDSIIKKTVLSQSNNKKTEKEFSKIYQNHKYWAKKPWFVVKKHVDLYSKIGDLVYDPFCGSGTTGLESILLGRNFVGFDINPVAVMVANQTLESKINISEAKILFENIKLEYYSNHDDYYALDELCGSCGKQLSFKYIRLGPKFESRQTGRVFCSHCKSRKSEYDRDIDESEKDASSTKYYKQQEYWYPKVQFPTEFYKDRFSYKGIRFVSDLYTPRNLYVLSIILNIIKKTKEPYKSLFMTAFSNSLLHTSILKSENIRPLGVNNYWIPDDYIEENVWFRFEERVKRVISSKEILLKRIGHDINIGSFSISCSSVLAKKSLMADYVFTDPPYGDAIQYSELSFVWNSWLGFNLDNKDEIIINPHQKKSEVEFNNLLNIAILNIYENLKKGGYCTICFQNKNFSVWKNIISKCNELGFALISIETHDTSGSSFNKNWSKFSPKTDIYVTFRKQPIEEALYIKHEEINLNIHEVIDMIISERKQHGLQLGLNHIYDDLIVSIIWALSLNSKVNIPDFSIKSISGYILDKDAL